jgi:uncharacterized protein with HEPN domain
MRREKLYLSNILEAADAIDKFLAGLDKDAFINSDLIRSAVLQKLTIIGGSNCAPSESIQRTE